MMRSSRPTVVIVDAHCDRRAALQRGLSLEADVVGIAGDADSAISLIRELQPEAVVMEVGFQGGGAPAVARALRELGSPVRPLVYASCASFLLLKSLFANGVERVILAPDIDELSNALRNPGMREHPRRGHFMCAEQWEEHAGAERPIGMALMAAV